LNSDIPTKPTLQRYGQQCANLLGHCCQFIGTLLSVPLYYLPFLSFVSQGEMILCVVWLPLPDINLLVIQSLSFGYDIAYHVVATFHVRQQLLECALSRSDVIG
ncbi:hypothetical protein B0I35DRAFT_490490, partial [Stachybotrys elegans]